MIGFLAHGQSKIRVGSAVSACCPTTLPLVIAEQFGTLASCCTWAGSTCGLGRAPPPAPTRPPCASAEARSTHRRELPRGRGQLQGAVRCGAARPADAGRAGGGPGGAVAGSSAPALYGAQLAAAALGSPYASCVALRSRQLTQAMELYRHLFKPSAQLAEALRDGWLVNAWWWPTTDDAPEAQAPVHLAPASPSPTSSVAAPRWACNRLDRRHRLPPLVAGRASRMASESMPRVLRRRLALTRCCHGLELASPSSGADELMVVSAIFDAGCAPPTQLVTALRWRDIYARPSLPLR